MICNNNKQFCIKSQYFNIEMDFFLSEYTDYSKWKKRTDTIYNAVHFYKYDDVIDFLRDKL